MRELLIGLVLFLVCGCQNEPHTDISAIISAKAKQLDCVSVNDEKSGICNVVSVSLVNDRFIVGETFECDASDYINESWFYYQIVPPNCVFEFFGNAISEGADVDISDHIVFDRKCDVSTGFNCEDFIVYSVTHSVDDVVQSVADIYFVEAD